MGVRKMKVTCRQGLDLYLLQMNIAIAVLAQEEEKKTPI